MLPSCQSQPWFSGGWEGGRVGTFSVHVLQDLRNLESNFVGTRGDIIYISYQSVNSWDQVELVYDVKWGKEAAEC